MNPRPKEEEEALEQSRAPLMSHIVELRKRVIWSLAGFLVATIFSFFVSEQIYEILILPVNRVADEPVQFINISFEQFFLNRLSIALFGGLFLSFPFIAYQVYRFVAPGLYRNERKAFVPYLVASPVLFALGAAIVYFLLLPLAIRFFLSIEPESSQTMPTTSNYLSLVMKLTFAFGLCFQLPVLLTLLARAGFTSADGLKKKRRYAIVGAFVAGAVLTPPDIISQIGLALPIILLYEISIWAVRAVEKRRAQADAEREAVPT